MGVQEFLSAGLVSLNESPSQKEGKLVRISSRGITCCRLNESPSKRKGNPPAPDLNEESLHLKV